MPRRHALRALPLAILLAATCMLTACERRAATTNDAPPPDATPAVEVATRFHETLARVRPSGAPTAAQLTELSPVLESGIVALLQRADSVRAAARTASPGEKPPFTDGDMFTSLFEGPTAFTVGTPVSAQPDEWRVPVALEHAPAGGTPTTWTDTLVVRMQDGRPVVADIVYGGHWDFALKGSLAGVLRTELGDGR
ncbi:MAG: hypothetical protein ACKO3S_01200 [bacterium]